MPHPNRVQPDGTFLATSARGMFMGNRGVLHSGTEIGAARWKHRAWVCCALSFRGRHRAVMPEGRYTALFFLDEAVSLAAGHRPCGECRRADYRRFADAWAQATGHWPGPKGADAALHALRAWPGGREMRRHSGTATALPPGAMFRRDGRDWLVADTHARVCRPEGYGPPAPLPEGPVEVLTNPMTLRVLAAGYRPALHPSATGH